MTPSNATVIACLETDAHIAEAVASLVAVEPRFAPIVAKSGMPALRRMAPGLESLLRIVNDQVLSLKAAERMWRKLEDELAPFHPAAILARGEAELRVLGLSGAKARSFLAIAAAIAQNDLPLAHLARLDDAAARAALLKVRGIGPWTADIYLLSCLGRGDVWPTGDLALQLAARDLFGLADRPGEKSMQQLAEPWRPWRAVAARLLWSHYRALKGLAQADS